MDGSAEQVEDVDEGTKELKSWAVNAEVHEGIFNIVIHISNDDDSCVTLFFVLYFCSCMYIIYYTYSHVSLKGW